MYDVKYYKFTTPEIRSKNSNYIKLSIAVHIKQLFKKIPATFEKN